MNWTAITGSPDYHPLTAVQHRVEPLTGGLIVGTQRGPEQTAAAIGFSNGLEVQPMPALYETLGARAIHMRNDSILDRLDLLRDQGHSALLLVFHDGREAANASMIAKARLRRHHIEVYGPRGVRHQTVEHALQAWRGNHPAA